MLSSSKIAEPETPVLKTGLVNVLLVNVSIVSLPISVHVPFGNVLVTSPDNDGDISLTF